MNLDGGEDLKDPLFVFRREISVGNIFTFVLWLIICVVAWTRLGDRADAQSANLAEERVQIQKLADTVEGLQENNATLTAMISSLHDRLDLDEQQIYGENRNHK